MDFNRLRLGELIAGACGALLLIDMFLSWYGIGGALGGGLGSLAKSAGVDTTANAWQSFSFIDLLLFLTAIAAITAAVLTMTQRSVALPVAASVIVTALGVLVTVLVLYRLFDQPGPNKYIDIKFGAYLGFLLCAGIALGGFMSMRDEGTSFSQAAADVQGGRGTGGPGDGGATRAPAAPPAAPPSQPVPPQQPPGATPPAGGPPPPSPPPSGGAPPAV